MKTLEYAVTNLNGNIESETLFMVDGSLSPLKLEIIHIDRLGRKFLHHRKTYKKEKKLTNINPVNMVKTFINNTDVIFKQINLN